ncbi:hypothetical protein HN709_03070, partial [Candidatus Peregrinibacteria bacterium]|nr:hypothetical protein [Candidatus Peregrinibacteria bacterium]
KIKTSDGPKKPGKSVIYANKRVRRLLLQVKSKKAIKWKDVPDTFTVKVNGKVLTVKTARKGEDGNVRPVIVRPEHKSDVAAYIKRGALSDQYTGEIAGQAHQLGATVIVGKVNRAVADLNRGTQHMTGLDSLDSGAQEKAISEYRAQKAEALRHARRISADSRSLAPYLHVALHGKKDYEQSRPNDSDIEIGSVNGRSCDKETRDWFASRLISELAVRNIRIDGRAPIVIRDKRLKGDPTKVAGPMAHGKKYKTLQIEVSSHLRKNHGEAIAAILVKLLQEFSDEVGSQEEPQGIQKATSDVAIDVASPESEPKDASGEKAQSPDLAEDQTSSESVEKPQKFRLKVREQFKSQVGKVSISKATADKIGATPGCFISISANDRQIEIAEVHVPEKLRNDVILLDAKSREFLGLKAAEESDFQVSVY